MDSAITSFCSLPKTLGRMPSTLRMREYPAPFVVGRSFPDDQLEPLIDDTLDAIEYAIGPADSKWGAQSGRQRSSFAVPSQIYRGRQ